MIAECQQLYVSKGRPTKKLVFGVLLGTIAVFIVLYFWNLWPKVVKPDDLAILKGFIPREKVLPRLLKLWMVLPYFGYFFVPISFYFFMRKEFFRAKLLLLLFSLFPMLILYKFDVFPIGNVFYIENLLTKPDFQLNLSIYDNVPYKFLVAYVTSISLVYLVYFSITTVAKMNSRLNLTHRFLLICFVTLFFSVLISSDFYDRYLLPCFVTLVLFFVVLFERNLSFVTRSYSKLVVMTVVFIFVFSTFSLTHEYMVRTRIKWLLAYELQSSTNYITQIYVDSTYGKYMNSIIRKDYAGLDSGDPISDYFCFIDDYTLEGSNATYKMLSNLDSTLENWFTKPRVFESRKIQGLPKVKNNLDDLMINVEYRSLLYNPVGKSSFVGAWCEDVI